MSSSQSMELFFLPCLQFVVFVFCFFCGGGDGEEKEHCLGKIFHICFGKVF
jgi:hypothetical protein